MSADYHRDAAIAYLIDCNRRLIRALSAQAGEDRDAYVEDAKSKLADADRHLMKTSEAPSAPCSPPEDSNGILRKGL